MTTSLATQRGSVSPLDLLQLAIEREGSVDVIERLAKLQMEIMDRESKVAYTEAFEQFKANVPAIMKDSKIVVNGSERGKYAKLDKICDVLIPELLKVNITHRWKARTSDDGKMIFVTCYLRHRMGYEEEGATLGGPPDTSGSKNAIQANGSTMAYLERYTLVAACGIAIKDQDTVDNPGMSNDEGANWVAAIESGGDAHETMESWTKAVAAAKAIEDYKAMTIFTEARDKRLKELRKVQK